MSNDRVNNLSESCFHHDIGRRDFFNRVVKLGMTSTILSLIPSAMITRALAAGDPDQNKWSSCVKCSSLFYNGYRTKGRCPAGREHFSNEGHDYLLTYDSSGPGQRNWRYCNKCQALFWNGYTDKGVCTAGGGHSAAGYNFTLRFDTRAPGESNWRFCNKCKSLFLNRANKGVCAATGAHVAAGYNFYVNFVQYIY